MVETDQLSEKRNRLADEIAYERVKALQRLKAHLLGTDPTPAQLRAHGCDLEIYKALSWKHPTKGFQCP
jgi:hypothetical protein